MITENESPVAEPVPADGNLSETATPVTAAEREEEAAEQRTDVARPLSSEGYDFAPATPDEFYDPVLADWFRETAQSIGMPVEMARTLHDRFIEHHAASGEAQWQEQEEQRVAGIQSLRREWAGTFDVNLALARRAVDELGGEALRDALEETGVGDHPALVKAFARTGQRLFGSAAGGEGEARTAIAAQREILRLRSDEGFMAAYADRGHPNHTTAQAQMDELYARAYPAGD